jgi:RNA polymerase sigma factor (sigma-70 family)
MPVDAEDRGQAAIDLIRAAPTNEDAWRAFYEYFRRQVAAALYVSGAARDEIPDLTQDAFRRFLQHSPWRGDWTALPERRTVNGYLCQTARRLVLDQRRKARHQPAQEDEIELDEIAAVTPITLTVPLERLIEQLQPDEQRLLRLLIEGEPLPEVAAQLGISYSAAAVRVHRLRKRIENISS